MLMARQVIDRTKTLDLGEWRWVPGGHALWVCLPNGIRVRLPLGPDGWTLVNPSAGQLTLWPAIWVNRDQGLPDEWRGWLYHGWLMDG